MNKIEHEEFTIFKGDCVQVMETLKKEMFDISVYSVPFASLFSYSKDFRDMGNSKDSDDEFLLHHSFFCERLFPVMKNGRDVFVHVANIVRKKSQYGHMGVYDFRGKIIRQMEDAGFIYYGECTINKNQQAVSIRTHSHKLAMQSYEKDCALLAPCLNDYLLLFQKPGENKVPVKSELSRDDWIRLADGIWTHIKETNTLNVKTSRSEDDERHVCPLQLDLIEDVVKMWSNRGETVFSPFMGIGSEGYVSLKSKRKFVGIELNETYFDIAHKNLIRAIEERDGQLRLI